MNITARHLLAASALVLSAVVAGCAGSGDKAGGDDPGEPLALTYVTSRVEDGATRFAEAVHEFSNGSMRIDVRDRWRDGQEPYESGIVEDVAAGRGDLGDVGVRAFDTMGVTSFQALVAPLLIDSVELQRAVASSDIPTPMLEALGELGVVGLGVVPGALRRPAGMKALLGADDYRGLRIGAREGAVAEMALRALGATPVLYPRGDLSTLDGAELDVEIVQGWGHREGVRAVAGNVVLWAKPMAIFADDDTFAALTTEQQEILRDAAAAVVDTVAVDVTKREAEDSLRLCGLDQSLLRNAAPADLASLSAAFEPVYRKLEENAATRRVIAEIRALRKTVEAQPHPTCARPPKNTTSDAANEALGVWEITYTQDELRGIGLSEEEIPKIAGKWTLEVTDGRWVSRHAGSSLTVEGEWAVADGVWTDTFVGCKPASLCTPGATFEYEVTIYKDTMIYKAIPGRPYDPFGVLKAWRRVG